MKRHLFPPSPNYLDTDRSSDIDVADAIHIARICRNGGFGRLSGRAMPCPQFILRVGLIFGARIEGFYSLLPDDRIIRMCNRKHLRAPEIISDYRRHAKHWDSLTDFLTNVGVRFRCLGFFLRMFDARNDPNGDGHLSSVATGQLPVNFPDVSTT